MRLLVWGLLVAACGGGGGGEIDAPVAPVDAGAGAPDAGDPVIAGEHPRIYLADDGVRGRLREALDASRPAAVRFRDMVDLRMSGTDVYAFEPWFAALLGELLDDAAYCQFAVDQTEAWVAGEEALIAAGERAEVAFDSYLYVGDHIGNLALVFDWCHELVTAGQRDRWLAYANHAVWNVWHHEEAVWGGVAYPWSGWSVDNPSNNYYYSFLRATLFLGLAAYDEHAEAPGWVTKFRDEKIGGQLVPTFNADLAGGGSREGTGYGVAMARLFHLYDVWEKSTGEPIKDLTGHTRASLVHFLHTVLPTLDRVAPVGDHARDATGALFDYHRNYVQTLAWLYPDDPVAPTARWWLGASSVPEMSQRFMFVWDFIYDVSDQPAAAAPELYPIYWAPGTGQLYMRSSWDTDATWVHLVAGPYTESHAHRDQSSFLLYSAGEWVAYDANIDSHSGIRQEEEMHNLVRIVDATGATVPQREGNSSTLVGLADSATYTWAAVDATAMYESAAGLTRVQRELVFLKPDILIVADRLDAAPETGFIWQLNTPGFPGGVNFMRFAPAMGNSQVTYYPDVDPDMNGGYRYDLVDAPTGSYRALHVFGPATYTDPSTGFEVTANGVHVAFAEDDFGVTIDGVALSGVEVLPELP